MTQVVIVERNILLWLHQYRVSLGGGTNLTKLTSGERALIGILGQTMYFSIGGDNTPHDISSQYICEGDLDTSKIASINVTISIQYCGVSILGIGFNESGTFQKNISSNSINGMISIFSSGDKPYFSSASTSFTINSFTTKDGKVHTVDNLNY